MAKTIATILVAGFALIGSAGLIAPPTSAAKGKVRKVSGKELVRMLRAGERVLVLDVRSGGTSDRIPNAVHVPLDRIDTWAATVAPDTKIVAYCT
jgi:hypothetical protein